MPSDSAVSMMNGGYCDLVIEQEMDGYLRERERDKLIESDVKREREGGGWDRSGKEKGQRCMEGDVERAAVVYLFGFAC